jgi:hypothetical protein
MGFDPNRTYRRRPSDYVLVVAALLICAGGLVWALVG